MWKWKPVSVHAKSFHGPPAILNHHSCSVDKWVIFGNGSPVSFPIFLHSSLDPLAFFYSPLLFFCYTGCTLFIWCCLNLKQFILFHPCLFFFNPIRAVPLAFGYSEGRSTRGQDVKQIIGIIPSSVLGSLMACTRPSSAVTTAEIPLHTTPRQILTWQGISMS